MQYSATPAPQGLYDPQFERDACGVAAVADIKGRRSHSIVNDGVTALINLDHRGAAGADPAVGDGAGILIQVPDELFRGAVDFPLPVSPDQRHGEAYAVGVGFLPADPAARIRAKQIVTEIVTEEGLQLLGWRTVPTDPIWSGVGQMALDVMPAFEQLFLAGPARSDGTLPSGLDLDRIIYPARKRIEHETVDVLGDSGGIYFASLSSRTIVYKGMLTTAQLPAFFADITDERTTSAIAIVHSRFSTNTFPAWPLAHPFRYIAHNGEINTVRGNRNRMRAREAMLASTLIPGDLARAFPICTPGAS
ncbi:MAG TPA: glutamate synthase subunit alpha, partial [Nakamurella sp.]